MGGGRRRTEAAIAVAWGLSVLVSSGPAIASAWNRQAGQGLVIVDYTFGSGADAFDGRGRLGPARTYTASELSAYVEYGATQSFTLIARPSLDDVKVGVPDAGTYRTHPASTTGQGLRVTGVPRGASMVRQAA